MPRGKSIPKPGEAEAVKPEAKKRVSRKKKTEITYDSVVGALGKKYSGKEVKLLDSLTAQIHLTGEAEGIFYLEIVDGVMNIMPFDYVNADLNINIDCESCMKLLDGKLDYCEAVYSGKIVVYGDLGKMLALKNLL